MDGVEPFAARFALSGLLSYTRLVSLHGFNRFNKSTSYHVHIRKVPPATSVADWTPFSVASESGVAALASALIFYGSAASLPPSCDSSMASLTPTTATAAPLEPYNDQEKSSDDELSRRSSAEAGGVEHDRNAAVLGRWQIPWAVKGVAFLLVITFNCECFPNPEASPLFWPPSS